MARFSQPWGKQVWDRGPERLHLVLYLRRQELEYSMGRAAQECGLSFAAYRSSEETLRCYPPHRIWQLARGLRLDPVALVTVAGYPTNYDPDDFGPDDHEADVPAYLQSSIEDMMRARKPK